MPRNIEILERVNGDFSQADSKLYPKTLPKNIIGLLENGKINEELLPGSVFGGMRIVNSLSVDIETGYEGSVGTLAEMIDEKISNEGGTASGLYFIASEELKVTATTSRVFEKSHSGSMEITLKSNDWLVCKGKGPNDEYLFAKINNTYNVVDSSRSGLMTPQQYSKLDGIADEANKYIHNNFTTRNIDATGVEVLDTFQSNSEGHVTGITKRTLPNADTSQLGVTSLASGNELKENLQSGKVVSSLSAKEMIDYFTGNTLYSNVQNADASDHQDGAIVFVEVN